MKTHLLIVLVGFPTLLFVSCTIEKRVHLPGYHIERTSQHAWKKRQQPGAGGQLSEQLPGAQEQSISPQPETVSSTNEQPTALSMVYQEETTVPVEQALRPAVQPASPELKTQAHPVPFRIPLPGSEKTYRQTTSDDASVSQADSRNRAGLLLAPIKLLFTILLIALIIVGVVLLFVLESALGGTVLLIAGAVLLILILL